jgi:hypothetical protein
LFVSWETLNGDLLHGFSNSYERRSNLFIELSSIWRKLQLTWNLVYMFIILKFNSKTTLNLILDTHRVAVLNFTFMQIQLTWCNNSFSHRKHSSLLGQIPLSIHTLWKGNECDDWLAKIRATNNNANLSSSAISVYYVGWLFERFLVN